MGNFCDRHGEVLWRVLWPLLLLLAMLVIVACEEAPPGTVGYDGWEKVTYTLSRRPAPGGWLYMYHAASVVSITFVPEPPAEKEARR